MRARAILPEAVLGTASQQAGVVSRVQLLDAGVTSRVITRRVGDGTLRPVTQGVYLLAETGGVRVEGVPPNWRAGDARFEGTRRRNAGGTTVEGAQSGGNAGRTGVEGVQPSWEALAWTGLLIGGPGAVLGGLAALHYDRLAHDPLPIDVYTGPADRHTRAQDPRWRFIRAERKGRGTPKRTSMGQSLLDATATMSENDTIALLLSAGRRFSLPHFCDLLAERKHHPHRKIMLQLINDVDEGADSVLELRYLRDVERAHKLPRAVRQAWLDEDRRCDVLYDQFATVVELDGVQWHSGAARVRDISRDNAARLKGLVTLRYTWSHVAETPCAVAKQVADALRQGGWKGTLHKCPRCA